MGKKIGSRINIIKNNNEWRSWKRRKLGIEAYGINSDPRQYVGATYRELREILARNKDFVKCIFKPEPTFLGNTIPVSGNGDSTND